MRPPAGTLYFRRHSEMPRELQEQLDELAFRHGRTFDSYLVTEADREYFWIGQGRGVVAFYRWLKFLHVVGGLLADDAHKRELLESFARFARANRKHVTFYNLVRDEAVGLAEHGFQVTKCGEEPLIDLAATQWQGRSYEWLRRQENFCGRQGLICREVSADPTDNEYRECVVPELTEISAQHIKQTVYGRELKFFEGRFAPLELRRRRMFVAESPSGAARPRIEAFVICNPARAGKLWAVEIYRKRTDAPRGVVPFLILRVARQLQREGIDHLSLSLCPTLRCEVARPGDSALLRWGMTFWWNHLNWIFDMRGIYHFKSRFRPEFQDRYIAAFPRLTFLSLRSFFLLWGILEPTPIRLVRQIHQKWKRRDARALLAEPVERAIDVPIERELPHVVPRELVAPSPASQV